MNHRFIKCGKSFSALFKNIETVWGAHKSSGLLSTALLKNAKTVWGAHKAVNRLPLLKTAYICRSSDLAN